MSNKNDGADDFTKQSSSPFIEEPGTQKTKLLMEYKDPAGQTVLIKRKQASLVMFSGGFDSTYRLVKLLRECDDDVVAHHIHLINRENRHKVEAKRCRAIVDHCKSHYREFHYTESAIDRHRFRVFGFDTTVAGFEAGIVANTFNVERGHPIDRWTVGGCLEEVVKEDENPLDLEYFKIMIECARMSCFPLEVPRYFQFQHVTKAEEIEYLGEELASLCWGCREPIYNDDGTVDECGTCHTCEILNKIRRGEPTLTSEQLAAFSS